jgi:hypothetical protein
MAIAKDNQVEAAHTADDYGTMGWPLLGCVCRTGSREP